MMIAAAVIDGAHFDRTVRRFFDDAATERIHVHFAGRWCWATTVRRSCVPV